ncbi:MAG: AMP-binding protein [Bacteroidota bacterium]
MAYSFLSNYTDPAVNNCTTYIGVIKNRTISDPNHVVFRFLSDGVNENESFTYKQLEIRAQAIGASIQKLGGKGDRVLLLFQPGLSYVASLFACFHSGFVGVLAYPPRRNRGLNRILSIISDSQANICIISQQVYDTIYSQNLSTEILDILNQINWIIYEDVNDSEASDFENTTILPNDTALLQYTSGSTGNPKGVIVTQLNLLYNSEYIRQSFGLSKSTVGVHWLPVLHDMGLIGGILQVAYIGGVNIGMPPIAFLKKPLNWLKAIEKYGGTTSGGPNFTYDYCIKKISDEECNDLDLSSISVMYNGAEQIRQSTYKQFAEKFAVSKFSEKQFYSCYGLAESTLIVTGGLPSETPKYLHIDKNALSNNSVEVISSKSSKAVGFVSCGHTWMETKIEIVDPLTLKKVTKNQIGEIWICGPTVANGYWNNPKETKNTFLAKLDDQKNINYLRTGDLGFIHQEELYVTGRIKDLIIIRGVNYYPNDIEYTIQKSSSKLVQKMGAAFSITNNGVESLVIVQELERTELRNTNYDKLIEDIRQIVAEEHELDIYSIVLIKTGSLPVTSSGKIKHLLTKHNYLQGNLNIVAQWKKEDEIEDTGLIQEDVELTADIIKEWLILWIMRNQHISRSKIELDKNIMSYGIDSLTAVTLEAEISERFGFQWHVSSFMLNPTIVGLAAEGMKYYRGEISEFKY